MDFLQRTHGWLLSIRAWIRKIHNALPNYAESEHGADEEERDEEFPPDRVRAVVSFDDETIRTTQAEAKRQYTIQNSIKNATWAAFVAVFIYALITILMWRQMIKQTRIASAALRQSTESFRTDERAWIEIEPVKGTLFVPRTEKIGAAFQYPVYIRNVGKTVARNIQLMATRGATQASIAIGDSAEALNWEQDKLLLGKVPTASAIPINNPVPRVLAPNTSAAVPLILIGQEPQYFPTSQWVSYLIGRVDYTDIFGVNHWMKFCFFVANPKGELWNCKEGNDEDRNSEN
jgi:hypothetical protein